MKIKTQKILRFIPLANFIVWFPCWHITAKKCNTNTTKHTFKIFIIDAALLLVITLSTNFLFELVNGGAALLISLLQIYLIGLSFSFVSVWDQEKMLAEHEQNKW